MKPVRHNKTWRKRIRKKLLKMHGNTCWWCKEKMEIPDRRRPAKNLEDMATIEHWFAKRIGDPNRFDLLRLAHKRCNKQEMK